MPCGRSPRWRLRSRRARNTIADAKAFAVDGGYYHWSGTTAEELYALTASNTYQQWTFAASGSGFTICNVGDGGHTCLSDGGGALDIGVATGVWTVAPSGSGYTIQSQSTQHYVSDAASPANGAAIGVSTSATAWSLASIGGTTPPAPPTPPTPPTGGCTGSLANLTVTPSTLSFGSSTIGEGATTSLLTVQNTGSAAVAITGVGIGGTNTGDFSEQTDCPASLPAGDKCYVRVGFDPTAAGSRAASAAINGSCSTGLTGTGLALASAFYVSPSGSDSASGTLAAPFKSLAKAQSAMQASSTKTTYLRAGVYSPGGSGLQLGGNDDNETWSFYPPDGVDSAIVDGGSTASGNGVDVLIGVGGTSHVTIDGLTVRNFDGWGIGGYNASNLTVKNSVISNGYSTAQYGAQGIACGNDCVSWSLLNNVMHDITGGGANVVAAQTGNISHLIYSGNVVYNTCTSPDDGGDCGALYTQDNLGQSTDITISGNFVRDGNPWRGKNAGSGIYLDDCLSNATVSGNVLTGTNGANTTLHPRWQQRRVHREHHRPRPLRPGDQRAADFGQQHLFEQDDRQQVRAEHHPRHQGRGRLGRALLAAAGAADRRGQPVLQLRRPDAGGQLGHASHDRGSGALRLLRPRCGQPRVPGAGRLPGAAEEPGTARLPAPLGLHRSAVLPVCHLQVRTNMLNSVLRVQPHSSSLGSLLTFATFATFAAIAAGCSSSADSAPAGKSGGAIDSADAGGTDIGLPGAPELSDGGSATASVACSVAAGFTITSTSSNSIALDWPTGATSVQIARKSYCGTDDYAPLATLTTAATYTDSTVQADWAYWYELTVTDASGTTVSQALGTQAAGTPDAACSAGSTPQMSGATFAGCASGGGGGGQTVTDGGTSSPPGDGGASAACVPPTSSGTDVTKAPYNVKNDGSDTTAALQSALTALAGQGTTALFPAGTYLVSKTISLPANAHLSSTAGAKIQVQSGFPSAFMMSTAGSNVTVEGLTFDSANTAVSAISLGAGSGYTLTNDTFQNSLTDTSSYTGEVTLYGTISGVVISHDSFENIGPQSYSSTDITNDYAPAGVWIDVGATLNGGIFDDNLFDHVGEGIHGPSSSTTLQVHMSNVELARNVMTHMHRIPIELQGTGDSMKITGNYVSDYVDPYWGTFGLSIAAPNTTNVLIEGNVVDGRLPTTVDGFWGISIEAGGFPVTVTGNYVLGYAGQTASVALISAHHTTVASIVHDNFFCGNAGDKVEYENPSTDPSNWRAPSPGDVLSPNTTTASCTGAPQAPPAPTTSGPCL